MTTLRDFSLETAHDACQRARLDFLATPCRGTGDVYRERAFRFWRARNRSSVGLDDAPARLDAEIDRAIEAAEMRRES